MSDSVLPAVARFGQAFAGSQRPDNSDLSWADGSWAQQLQPGSWRGVGFVLDAGGTAGGRRVAIHEYPYRDTAWAEDLGKLPRRFGVQAFIVGDDCYQQRDAMLAAAEQPGAGTLVHPTLGSMQCVLLEFACNDRRERGRVVELQFSFIVAGDVQFPASLIATGQQVTAASSALSTASASDLGATLASAGPLPGAATASVPQFTGMASSAVDDAARVFNAVAGLQGFHGRYAVGSRATLQDAGQTVPGALADATTARTRVNTAAATVDRLGAAL